MKLTKAEASSAAWKRTKAWAEAELTRHRTQLEADKTELQTARLRGQIASLKELIKLGEEDAPRPVVESTDHLYPR